MSHTVEPTTVLAAPSVIECIERGFISIEKGQVTYQLNQKRSYNWGDAEEWIRCSTIAFLIIALVAAVLGFTTLENTAAWAAKITFIVFLVLIGVLVACAVFSFGVLPGMNVGVAIPVIMVPGEPYDPTLPVESFRWTNTLTAMVLSSLAVIVFAVLAWRDSKGWTKQVPGRYQSWVELLGGFLYGQAKQMAGKNARLLFPLVASIFVFLLAVNWMKLLPGVESVGVLHCAEEGFNGYPMVQIGNGAYQLYVDRPLNGGTGTSHEDYEACEHYKHDPSLKPSKEAVESVADQLEIREAELVERLNVEGILGEAQEPQIAAQRLLAAESLYEHATMPLSAEQLREGAVPYSFVITPYAVSYTHLTLPTNREV